MTCRSITVRSAIVIASLLMAPSAHAECFTLTARFVMQEKVVELVFGDTVMNVVRTAGAEYRATFDVDRVWKGSVSRCFDLYVFRERSSAPRPASRRYQRPSCGQRSTMRS